LGAECEDKGGLQRSSHKARYHAVSKQRWSSFQKGELQLWGQRDVLQQRQAFIQTYYLPLLKPLFENTAGDTPSLEIGCGPVCVAQHLTNGKKTYLDPLINDYKRLFPGTLPEQSCYIAEMAEEVPLPKRSFDSVLCLNSLCDTQNPELVLHKVKQVLKPTGYFIVSMELWPSLLSRGHYFLSRFAPSLPRLNRLYSYTRQGFINTLCRHFNIVAVRRIQPRLHWLSLRQEWLFVCELPEERNNPHDPS
ncbi:MAG: class I SAM-dependent methyltransferase, partial [Ghiorsea sp.]